ncbi:MerR family transcriptional regulator [Sphingomonas echinoides]|uniref:MerR family transcriptional regulator n=1 Tax=Sphingomonas echinoides TaxID=59803 RepID=A0ABU4PI84_9SPHN|nr:MerR family transcriptional regulator [Sphingomonas echinoides]MDX5982797.1 MerR family transcriptional regulator [Sphingomonas echinoides]
MAVPPANADAPAAAESGGKAAGAYRTIGELSRETGLPQHILRYWETRFPQLRPLQRAGNRRYYRPEDVALVRRIAAMLEQDGYTIRGVQKALLAESKPVLPRSQAIDSGARDAVLAVRTALAAALAEDE